MAPTEIASWHARALLKQHLAPYDQCVTLVTGSMKASERGETPDPHCANGDAQAIIGITALFQKDMVYYNWAWLSPMSSTVSVQKAGTACASRASALPYQGLQW